MPFRQYPAPKMRIVPTRNRKPHRHDVTRYLADAIEPSFVLAMFQIIRDDARRIQECKLRIGKGHAMLTPVLLVLG